MTAWCRTQIPRALCGLGDLHSSRKRHAEAAGYYLRALPLREEILKTFTDDDVDPSHLKARRLFVEAHVLVAEELLAWDPEKEKEERKGVDKEEGNTAKRIKKTTTTTSATKKGETDVASSSESNGAETTTAATNDDDDDVAVTTTSVPPSERVEYARGYYDKGRDELQEAVYLMGRVAAKHKSVESLGTEKEDLCFLATMLMGVGNTLADLDEKNPEELDDDGYAMKKVGPASKDDETRS